MKIIADRSQPLGSIPLDRMLGCLCGGERLNVMLHFLGSADVHLAQSNRSSLLIGAHNQDGFASVDFFSNRGHEASVLVAVSKWNVKSGVNFLPEAM